MKPCSWAARRNPPIQEAAIIFSLTTNLSEMIIDGMSKMKYEKPTVNQSSKYVYVLSFLQQTPQETWTGEFVGVYSSLEEAEDAKKRVLTRPSYSDSIYSFRVDGVKLNTDYDGSHFFSSPPPSGPPPNDAGGPKSTET